MCSDMEYRINMQIAYTASINFHYTFCIPPNSTTGLYIMDLDTGRSSDSKLQAIIITRYVFMPFFLDKHRSDLKLLDRRHDTITGNNSTRVRQICDSTI